MTQYFGKSRVRDRNQSKIFQVKIRNSCDLKLASKKKKSTGQTALY